MELFVKSAAVKSTSREHPEDTRKSFSCTVELQLQSIGEFPLDEGNPRGTQEAARELLMHLLMQHFNTKGKEAAHLLKFGEVNEDGSMLMPGSLSLNAH